MPETGWAVLTPAKHILSFAPTTLVKNMMAMGTWQGTPAGTSGHPRGPPIHAILVRLTMSVLGWVGPTW